MTDKMKKFQIIVDIFLIIISSVLSAVGLYCFVNPANFAPVVLMVLP